MKSLKYLRRIAVLVLVLALVGLKANAQLEISGTTCVVSGQSYIYTISGSWSGSTYMSWTITGNGNMPGYGISRSGTPLPQVTVVWTGSGTLTLTTSNPSGNKTINITITAAVNGGNITTNQTQTITYGTIPAGISCSAASGGTCTTTTYQYQWFHSPDNVNWNLIAGATSLNLSLSNPITQTTYYRRSATADATGMVGYSGSATAFVMPQLQGGTISTTSPIVNYGQVPAQLNNAQSAQGGNCGGIYQYKWQKSPDNITFTDIPENSSSIVYAPETLSATTYFRRKVTCGTETAYSNTLTITVNPQVLPGAVTPSLYTIASGAAPGVFTGTAASGGACSGSFTYQWEKSTDGMVFTTISGATALNYTPPALTATTYYRRKVTCGTDMQYSNMVTAAVGVTNVNYNYIRERIIKKSNVTDSAAAANLTGEFDVQQMTSYFDGIGRPLQTVIRKASPLVKDLVNFNLYDNTGDEPLNYLPYVSTTNDGNYKATILQDQNTFNTARFAGEQYFYSQKNTEPSPLSRTLSNYAPGLNWVGASRGVSIQYQVNAVSDSVRSWSVALAAGSLPTSSGFYGAGTLFKSVTIDEHNKQVVEYRNNEGNVLLKKVQVAASPGTAHVGWLCTYYIYDELNNLRFVLQPRALELINSTWNLTDAIGKELCFRYDYDQRNRMIIKRVPGGGQVFMVYDARDRLIMTQDSVLKGLGKWMVSEYDSLNRVWRTGLFTNANNRAYHQNLANTSITYPNTSSNYEVLTQTYFDDYTWVAATGTTLGTAIDATYTGSSTYFNTTYNTSPVYARQITPSYQIRGAITGTKTKLINSVSQFLYSENFYDDRGRVIQTQSTNITGNKDISTTQYDFNNKIIRNLLQHSKGGTNAQTHKVLSKLVYDAGGRLLTVHKNIDDAGTDQLITTNTYNELGQLQNNAKGNSIETLEHAFNIRGWLTSVNKNYLTGTPGNYFGYELAYDKTTAAAAGTSYSNAQYNGNISGTIWKSKGDGVNRKFDYVYDNVNRLIYAGFNQNSVGTTWSNSLIDFTVSNLNYDANGNIKTMRQKGFKVNGSALIDQLLYTYTANTNRLIKVADTANDVNTRLGDFHDGANGATNDYDYNGIGSLTQDLNKAISSITYNHLNLPNVVTVTGKGTITYDYDASGGKLKKTTVEGAKTTTTLYLGNFQYVNDTLQFIGHEEGRTRWAFHKYLNGNTEYKFEYDYFLKDHLGNVRMVLTQQKDTTQYMATMEAAYRTTENQLFYNLQASNHSRAAVGGYPADATTTPNDSIMKLNGSGQKVGAAIILKVMSGDVIDLAVKAYYTTQTGTGTGLSLNDVLSSFANGIVTVASGAKGSLADLNNTSTSPLFSAITSFATANNQTIPSKPRAYLNWILLDEQLQYVSSYPQSGAVAVGNTAAGTLNTLGYTGIPITKNGYLYIYVNNETQGWDVFFDNLAVKHYTGPLLEETHYYPFGLTMAGISSRALKADYAENKKGYNGNDIQNKEFNDGSGLELYDFNARTYDQQIGRFIQIDPKTDEASQETFTPYQFGLNNPIRYNDPDGKCPPCLVAWAAEIAAAAAEILAVGAVAAGTTKVVTENPGFFRKMIDAHAEVIYQTGSVSMPIGGFTVAPINLSSTPAEKDAENAKKTPTFDKQDPRTDSDSRSQAWDQLKENNAIPRGQQPDRVIKPNTPEGDKAGLDNRNVRQYEFDKNAKGNKVVVREDKAATYPDGGTQLPHFNVGQNPAGPKELTQHHYFNFQSRTPVKR